MKKSSSYSSSVSRVWSSFWTSVVIKRIIIAIFLVLALLAIELERFFLIQPHRAMPLVSSSLLDTDDSNRRSAIVLTGSQVRLQEATALLREGRLDLLFISGVYPSVRLSELLAVLSESNVCVGDVENCIELGHRATNTRGNACESLAWLEQHGVERFYLVTSDYHWVRSHLEFAMILQRYGYGDVEILPYLVAREGDFMKQWGGEYLKWVIARGRIFLEGVLLGEGVGGCPVNRQK